MTPKIGEAIGFASALEESIIPHSMGDHVYSVAEIRRTRRTPPSSVTGTWSAPQLTLQYSHLAIEPFVQFFAFCQHPLITWIILPGGEEDIFTVFVQRGSDVSPPAASDGLQGGFLLAVPRTYTLLLECGCLGSQILIWPPR